MVSVINLVLKDDATVAELDNEFSDLIILPGDSGGSHIANVLGTTVAAYGYCIYLTFGYDSVTLDYFVLIFPVSIRPIWTALHFSLRLNSAGSRD